MTNSTETQDADRYVYPARRQVLWIAKTVSYLVYFYLLMVEVILAVGFFLLLFGANPSAGFVTWIYRSLDRTMKPFRGMFSPIELGVTGNQVESIIETSILFAMVIYGIVAIVAHTVVVWLSDRLARVEFEERERQRVAALDLRRRPDTSTRPVPIPEVSTAPDSVETGRLPEQP